MSEIRYLANSGDDNADGMTPETAWRTIKRLNEGLPAGGTAKLKCGDVFYGHIKVKGGADAEHPTAVTSYGDGPKPVLSFSKILKNDPAIWETGKGTVPLFGIWRTDLTNPENYIGVESDNVNPGVLLVDGVVKPWRKFCRHDINQQWDFTGDRKWLYVYSTENPADLSDRIEVSLCEGVLLLVSNMVVSNLSVKMSGGCAMCGGWTDKSVVSHIRISDCDFENIGGSELVGFESGEDGRKARFGNGIEFGHNVQDVIVERCSFNGVYDTGFTMQGFPSVSWSDVHVRDCYFTECSQAYELWCRNAPAGVGYERCSFTGNRCVNVGGGWGAETRPNRSVATPLLMYFMDTDTMDVDVSGNTFENCPRGVLFKLGGLDQVPAGYRMHDNSIVVR